MFAMYYGCDLPNKTCRSCFASGEPTQPTATMFSDGGMGLPVGIEAARGAENANPALATHTVQMDEDDEVSSSGSSNQDSSNGSGSTGVASSGAKQQLKLPLNGGGAFRLPGSSSSNKSSKSSDSNS